MTARPRLITAIAAILLAAPAYGATKSASPAPPQFTAPAAPAPSTAPMLKAPNFPNASAKLQKCLQRAEELPDIAALEAAVWQKQGGGDEAHLCRAFAQADRAMHADSAREFWYLASRLAKRDPKRSIFMHDLAGTEFMRDKDDADAEGQYTAALKLDPSDADSLLGRAESRAAQEKYWDAIDDLNRALKVDPKNAEIWRRRGDAWLQLGNAKNAQQDLEQAAVLTGERLDTPEAAPVEDK